MGEAQTELSPAAQREIARARREGPATLGRLFEDTPGIVQRDSQPARGPMALEEWAAAEWVETS